MGITDEWGTLMGDVGDMWAIYTWHLSQRLPAHSLEMGSIRGRRFNGTQKSAVKSGSHHVTLSRHLGFPTMQHITKLTTM